MRVLVCIGFYFYTAIRTARLENSQRNNIRENAPISINNLLHIISLLMEVLHIERRQ